MTKLHTLPLAKRFRGFLPVVVDVETAGFNPKTDALLEIAAISLIIDKNHQLQLAETLHEHIEPFPGANLEPDALAFTKIDPGHPLRFALSEKQALQSMFAVIAQQVKRHACQRAVLVGHNPFFDLSFIQAACQRQNLTSPFHSFTTFDTASLAAVATGQTVLAKACKTAGIPFNTEDAHSALYDAQRTAELFCHIVNRWQTQG